MLSAFFAISKHTTRYSHLQPPQLSQPSQPSDAGIAGIHACFAEVINHLVPVIGTDGDGNAAPLLHFEEGTHHGGHIDITFQVVGLVEVAFGVALGAAEVDEVDAVAKLAHHRREVIVCPYA